MSVIVYRAGILAADTRAFLDRYSASPGAKAKIRRCEDDTLVGVTTPTPGLGEVMMNWFEAGADPTAPFGLPPEDFTMLVVLPDGKALIYIDSLYPTGPLEAPFYAIGSGSDYALGAMHYGATAEEAVLAATRFDPFCAEPVLALRHAS